MRGLLWGEGRLGGSWMFALGLALFGAAAVRNASRTNRAEPARRLAPSGRLPASFSCPPSKHPPQSPHDPPNPIQRKRFYALKHGSAIFFEGGPAGLPLAWGRDAELFERWAAGRTGMPLVDANMRELAATGAPGGGGRGSGGWALPALAAGDGLLPKHRQTRAMTSTTRGQHTQTHNVQPAHKQTHKQTPTSPLHIHTHHPPTYTHITQRLDVEPRPPERRVLLGAGPRRRLAARRRLFRAPPARLREQFICDSIWFDSISS